MCQCLRPAPYPLSFHRQQALRAASLSSLSPAKRKFGTPPHPDTSPLPQRPRPRYPPPMQALTNNTNTANQLTRHEAIH